MSAEDDPARTITPRLVAGGADLTKVHILESVIHANGSEALPSLRADIDAITAAAARLGDCRLIVIDPVSAYLEGVDDNRNAALRGVLTPLNSAGRAAGCRGRAGESSHQGKFSQRQASRAGLDCLCRGLPGQPSVRCRPRRPDWPARPDAR